MDNSYVEQPIRPFTIGRKNFVMIESSNGTKTSAILYSLVKTAKANMLNIFEYFNLLLTEVPQHMEDKDLHFLDDLLPWSPRVQKECPSRYKKSWFFNVPIYSVKSAQSALECGDFWYPVLMFEDLLLVHKLFLSNITFSFAYIQLVERHPWEYATVILFSICLCILDAYLITLYLLNILLVFITA